MTSSTRALLQRVRPLFWLGACFLAIAFIVRLVLLIWAGHAVPPNPLSWIYIFGVGLVDDLITFVYVAWPLVLYLWLMPTRAYRSRPNQWVVYVIGLALLYGLMFVAVSEWVFWGEFSTRFNFIAVDYLVYTTEVIGNIQQSYPIGLWMMLIGLAATVVTWLTRRGLSVRDEGSTFGRPSDSSLPSSRVPCADL